MRTFEYKLRPNKTQEQELDRLLWETKCLYNSALEQLINHYKESINSDQTKHRSKSWTGYFGKQSVFTILLSNSS